MEESAGLLQMSVDASRRLAVEVRWTSPVEELVALVDEASLAVA